MGWFGKWAQQAGDQPKDIEQAIALISGGIGAICNGLAQQGAPDRSAGQPQ
jgi:hypothetical protein